MAGPRTLVPRRFLVAAEVCEICRFSRATLYRKVRDGKFPKPYLMSNRPVWKVSEVDAWIEAQHAPEDAPPSKPRRRK